MTVELDVQRACSCDSVPDDSRFLQWTEAALAGRGDSALTIRIVDREESAELNLRFRSVEGPTNVLSFAAELPAGIGIPLLGDIVICAPLVSEQARLQGKGLDAHWAHLVIHGVLHLLGYDHQADAEAREMESREIDLLESLGFSDPYQ